MQLCLAEVKAAQISELEVDPLNEFGRGTPEEVEIFKQAFHITVENYVNSTNHETMISYLYEKERET